MSQAAAGGKNLLTRTFTSGKKKKRLKKMAV